MSELVKQDVNFLEYPIWQVCERHRENTYTDLEGYTYRVGYKMPTCVDVIFLYYLMFVSQSNNWKQKIKVSKYNILKNCKIPINGYYIKRIEESLKRWINVTLEFTGTFYDNKKYLTLNFNILNDWYIDEKDNTLVIEFNKFWLEKVKESKYFKMLKFDKIINLKSPIATRLYEILIKNFQNREIWEIDAHKLAKKITMKEKYLAHIIQKIKPAVNKINKQTDLNIDLKIRKKERNKAIFVFIKRNNEVEQYKQDKMIVEQTKNKEPLSSNETLTKLLKLLPDKEKNKKTIKDAIIKAYKKHGMEYCKRNIEYANEHANENYRVFLIKALKEDWGLGWWEERQNQEKEKEQERLEKAKKYQEFLQRIKPYVGKTVRIATISALVGVLQEDGSLIVETSRGNQIYPPEEIQEFLSKKDVIEEWDKSISPIPSKKSLK